MHETQLTILAPGLMHNTELLRQSQSNFKSFRQFFRAAERKDIHFTEDALKFHLILKKVPAELPVAALSAMADGLGPDQHWIRADPIALRVDLTHIYQLGTQHLALSQSEIERLVSLINPLFLEYGLKLLAPHPQRFYIACKYKPKIRTHNPEAILGKSIFEYLPQGTEQTFWLRLFTETQMLLHDSDFNRRRRENNKPTVDALWFWGQGKADFTEIQNTYMHIYSNNPVITGLALSMHIPCESFNGHFSELVNSFSKPGEYLVATDQFSQLVCAENSPWEIERQFFYPIVQALRVKKITKLLLYPDDKHCYYVAAKNFYRWWKFW